MMAKIIILLSLGILVLVPIIIFFVVKKMISIVRFAANYYNAVVFPYVENIATGIDKDEAIKLCPEQINILSTFPIGGKKKKYENREAKVGVRKEEKKLLLIIIGILILLLLLLLLVIVSKIFWNIFDTIKLFYF